MKLDNFVRSVLLVLCFCLTHSVDDRIRELKNYNPEPNPNSVVEITPTLQITFISDRILRIQRRKDSSQVYDDRATLAIQQRWFKTPGFTIDRSGSVGIQSIRTEFMQVHVSPDSNNVKVVSTKNEDSLGWFKTWNSNETSVMDSGNLLGTIRTLDGKGVVPLNCSHVHDKGEKSHCEPGLLSRGGWAVIDDSDTPRIDRTTGWWRSHDSNLSDLYFFGFGLDFKKALEWFSNLSGQAPMFPRSALGVWWTRWYNYDELELEEIYNTMQRRSMPLHVLVLDMNWHTKPSWGSYSWDRNLIKYPGKLFRHFKGNFKKNSLQQARRERSTMEVDDDGSNELRILVNVHDDSGMSHREEQFEKFAAALGVNGTKIKFAYCENPEYAFALEDIVLESLRKDGVDHFWIDWQQGGHRGGCTGGKHNPTIWLNRVRHTRTLRKGINKRELILSRWGGLGSHRYPVGFSGDVRELSWENLAFQPYFTLTASNVLFGYWSHDITGPLNDSELTVRWIQWGVFSPILRFHDRGGSAGLCYKNFPESEITNNCWMSFPWQLPPRYYHAVEQILAVRVKLIPLLYNLLLHYHQTGVGPLRPMYYDYPRFDEAYLADAHGNFAQFMLGDDLLVAPVVSKSNVLASKVVWIPPGVWRDTVTGQLLQGPQNYTFEYDLEEVPVFLKVNSILPMSRNDPTQLHALQYNHLELNVILDNSESSAGSFEVYQDDGTSFDYLKNSNPQLTAVYERCEDVMLFKLTNIPTNVKTVTISLPNTFPVNVVNSEDCHTSLTYNALALTSSVVVETTGADCTVHLSGVETIDSKMLGRMLSLRRTKASLDEIRAGLYLSNLTRATSAVLDLQEFGENGDLPQFKHTVEMFNTIWFPEAVSQVKKSKSLFINDARRKYIERLLDRLE